MKILVETLPLRMLLPINSTAKGAASREAASKKAISLSSEISRRRGTDLPFAFVHWPDAQGYIFPGRVWVYNRGGSFSLEYFDGMWGWHASLQRILAPESDKNTLISAGCPLVA